MNLLSLQEQLEMAMQSKTGFLPTQQLLTPINEDLEALENIYQCGLAQERASNDVLSLCRIQLGTLNRTATRCMLNDADDCSEMLGE
jgi:hypothetical protein